MATKTVCIFGATGQSGKWALKGALQRGWKAKVICRNKSKLDGLLKDIFPEKGDNVCKEFEGQLTSVKCGGFDETVQQEAFSGCDAVLSFVGMSVKGENVVDPCCRAVVSVMKRMKNGPKMFVFQSAIGTSLDDSKIHGSKALGKLMMCAIPCVSGLKQSFADMTLAEEFIIEAREANPGLNLIPLRCAILEDQSGLIVDYTANAKGYVLIRGGELGEFSSGVDRQYVAQAALDLVGDCTGYENKNVSCCNRKKPKKTKVAPET